MKNYKQGISAMLIGMLLIMSLPIQSIAAPTPKISIDGAVVKTLTTTQQGGLWYFNLDRLGKSFDGTLKLNEKTGLHYFKLAEDIIQFKANATTVKWNGLSYVLKQPIIQKNKAYYMSESMVEELFRIAVDSTPKTNTISMVSPGRSVTLTELSGSVEILKKGDPIYNWKAAKSKAFLFEKDSIRTGKKSKVEVLLNDGSKILIGENATVVLDKLSSNTAKKNQLAHIRLIDGELWATVVKQTNGSEFVILKDDHKLTAYGTVVYAGPANTSVLSGLVVDQFDGKSNNIPTGTAAIYGSEPILMDATHPNWETQGQWAMQQLEELQSTTIASNLAAIQMSSELPAGDPSQTQLLNSITDSQNKALWNQFEIRQTAPLTDQFPSEASMMQFVKASNEIQDLVNKSSSVSSAAKNNLFSGQQIILDQFQQNLKVADIKNLIPAAAINELSNYSNAIETKLPANLTLDPNKLPVVPMPPNSKLPEIGIPTDIKLPEGMVIPPGFNSEFSSILPEGSMLPKTFNFSEATTLPENLMLPPATKLPDNFNLPRGTVIPPGMDVRSLNLPEGVSLPKGVILAKGLQLPNGVELPAGFKMPSDVKPPTDLTTFKPPIGYSPPPNAKLPPSGPIDPKAFLNALQLEQVNIQNPNIIKDMTANGGVQIPTGFTPPEGFIPPIGWKPPQNFAPSNNALPQGWEIIPPNYAETNPALLKSFQSAVDSVFIGNMKMPNGFELPMGVKPSDQFKPPTDNWQPPKDWQPPQGFTPPTEWKLPKNWQPEAGFAAPPGFGEIPGKFTKDGWIPPKEFTPPEWWTPPKEWSAGQPLPKGTAPWEQLGAPIPGGGMTLPEGFVPPNAMFDPSKPPIGGPGTPTQPPGMPPGKFPPGTQPPGMPPGTFPPGTQPPGMPPGTFPPGTQPPGMPPGTFPPGTQPPGMPPGTQPPGGIMPPGTQPPGSMPPGGMPPGTQPPGGMPPGTQPPGGMPPGTQPPGGMPPGTQPPGGMPPGTQPPGGMKPPEMPGPQPPGGMQPPEMPGPQPPGGMQPPEMPGPQPPGGGAQPPEMPGPKPPGGAEPPPEMPGPKPPGGGEPPPEMPGPRPPF